MSNNKLLFKNNLKNILKNKIQFIGLVFLVFLTSFIFTITDITNSRIQSVYDEFISEKMSNQHDFIIDYSETTYNSRSFKDLEEDPFFKNFSNLEQRQEFMLHYLKDLVQEKEKELAFDFDRVETRTFALNSKKVLKAITLNAEQKIDKFVVQRGMPLEFWNSYRGALNDYSKRWVYISPGFAKANNIGVNDIIRMEADSYGNSIKVTDDVDLSFYDNKDINTWISDSKYTNENWFRVVGIGSSADFVSPIIDQTKPIPNSRDEGLIYVNPELFGNFNEEKHVKELDKEYTINQQIINRQVLLPKSSRDVETYYVGKFKDSTDAETKASKLNSYINTEKGAQDIGIFGFNQRTGDTSSRLLTHKLDSSYKFAMRTTFLDITLEVFNLLSLILMVVILVISFFVLVTIIKKQIQNTTRQNGILRALGCRRYSIVTSYLAYPLMIALAGGILGFIVGMSFQEVAVNLFKVYFNIPFQNFIITLTSLFTCVFLIFILLTFVTIITCILMMNKTPLEMIYSDGKSSTNRFKLALKKGFTFRKNFNSRFRAALFSNSIDKMVGVAATMIVSTAVIGIATITPLVLKDNIRYTYYNTSYTSEVEYYQPIYNIPTSFYKTYDPTVKAWNANEENYFTSKLGVNGTNLTDDVDVLINQYLTAKINPETYSPTFNPRDLTNLLYKNTSKEFLKSNKIALDNSDQNNLSKIIIESAWPDYKEFGLANLKDKGTFLEWTSTYQNAKTHIEDLENLRKFYVKYRDTVGLDVKRPEFFNEEGQFNEDNKNLISSQEFEDINRFPARLNSKGQLYDEFGYDTPLSQQLETSAIFERVQFLTYSIWNWAKAYFIDNVNQAFIQGIYFQSPYEVRKSIKESFENNTQDYNILFGVVPYTPETDDIGTYFQAMSTVGFNVYGIKETSKNQQLIDRSTGKNLISELYKTEKGIVLNATLAKQLNLRVGQKMSMHQLETALYKGDEKIKTSSWDSSDITGEVPNEPGRADGPKYTNSKYLYSGSGAGQDSENLIRWKNSEIKAGEYILNSTVDPLSGSSSPVKPSQMNTAVVNGEIGLKSNYEEQNDFVVTGITNQYGSGKAWIREDEAQKITKYDESEAQLFQLFIKEWSNPYVKNDSEIKNKELLDELRSLKKYQMKSNQKAIDQYQRFKSDDDLKHKADIQKMFANEYPLFNYKLSASKNIDDINSGLTQTQSFGDYSVPAMQGGTYGDVFYPSFGREAAANLLPKEQTIATLESVMSLANSILIFIAVISVILSFVIIMLTSNVIIAENMRVIATMKVLGYSNRTITNLVLSMYIPVVIVTTIMGFFIGYGIMALAVGILAVQGTIVPFMLQWYWPLFVTTIVFILYTISYLMSWYSMNRVNPLKAIFVD